MKIVLSKIKFISLFFYNRIPNYNKFTMSFFGLSPRNITSSSKSPIQTGPGAYDTQNSFKKSHSKGYAPFGSVEKKKFLLQNKNVLGPGLYDVSGQICKPSITKYQNPNSIIIKINEQGWSQFKSKTNRFQTNINETQNTPGPGQYDFSRSRPKTQTKDLMRSSIGEKIKQINLKNYIERRKPTLITDPVKIIPNDQPPQKNKHKGLSWSLNKKQRFQPLIKQPFQEEHKIQFIDKIRNEKKKQRSKSQSAVFASKTLKSHFQSQIYHTSNPFKVQLRKMIDYKDQRPGPGSYDYEDEDIRKKIKFSRHQFFGSTVQRFKTQSSIGQNLGPGYYTPKVNSLNKSPVRQNIPEQPVINRHSYIPTNTSELGPGTYSLDKQKKHKASCKWVFGSKRPRFSQESTLEQNQEEIDENELLRKMRRQKQFQYRKQFLNSGNHANFASTSKRFQDPKIPTQKIPVGHYNVTHTDIGSKLKRSVQNDKQAGKTNHHVGSAPFKSTVERFKTEQEDEQNHGHHDCWCLVKSVEKQVYEHQSSFFSSKDKRTVVFQNKANTYSPAVGTYNQESSFIKNSFNSRFLKANQAKSKKLRLWNAQKNKNSQKKQPSLSVRQQQISMLKIN